MLLLTKRQWALLATQLSALANLAAAALIFGQFIGVRPFSAGVVFFGSFVWLVVTALALVAARKESQ